MEPQDFLSCGGKEREVRVDSQGRAPGGGGSERRQAGNERKKEVRQEEAVTQEVEGREGGMKR